VHPGELLFELDRGGLLEPDGRPRPLLLCALPGPQRVLQGGVEVSAENAQSREFVQEQRELQATRGASYLGAVDERLKKIARSLEVAAAGGDPGEREGGHRLAGVPRTGGELLGSVAGAFPELDGSGQGQG